MTCFKTSYDSMEFGCNTPYPAGYSPTGETGWRVPPSVVSFHLVDPNKKTETIIDGTGFKPLTSRCNMVPASA